MLIKRIVEPRAIIGIVAIARGGLIPGTMLAHKLGIRNMALLSIASYSDDRKQGMIIMDGGLPPHLMGIRGKGWLIMDDLVDSGNSMRCAKALLPEAKTAALMVKHNASIKPDFYVTGAPADVWVVFPWEEK